VHDLRVPRCESSLPADLWFRWCKGFTEVEEVGGFRGRFGATINRRLAENGEGRYKRGVAGAGLATGGRKQAPTIGRGRGGSRDGLEQRSSEGGKRQSLEERRPVIELGSLSCPAGVACVDATPNAKRVK
jgi:hypothetical protein